MFDKEVFFYFLVNENWTHWNGDNFLKRVLVSLVCFLFLFVWVNLLNYTPTLSLSFYGTTLFNGAHLSITSTLLLYYNNVNSLHLMLLPLPWYLWCVSNYCTKKGFSFVQPPYKAHCRGAPSSLAVMQSRWSVFCLLLLFRLVNFALSLN